MLHPVVTEPLSTRELSRKRQATDQYLVGTKHFKSQTMLTETITSHTDQSCRPSMIIFQYFDMVIQLCEVLALYDPQNLIKECECFMASTTKKIPLFSADFIKVIKETRSTPVLIQRLAPFTNWLDHSILTAVVEACNVPEAAALLTQFDDRIDTSQPVTKYPVPFPSHYMVPYDTSTHTVLAVQLKLQLDHSTLQNVLDTRSLIQEKCEVTPHCLQLLAVAKTSHTIIYWIFPKHVTSLVTSCALQNQRYFYQNGIQQVAVYPGTMLVTSIAPINGPFSFFNKVSLYDAMQYYNINCFRWRLLPVMPLPHKFVSLR